MNSAIPIFLNLLAYLLLATAAESASAMTSRVIFISPNNAYFISNQGEANGFVAGKDDLFMIVKGDIGKDVHPLQPPGSIIFLVQAVSCLSLYV